jgi:L-aspartate oxidase
LDKSKATAPSNSTQNNAEVALREVQELMWRDVGIVRDGAGLRRALHHLGRIGVSLPEAHSRRDHETRNVHLVGSLIAKSALAREESRGAHYRTDCPSHNDAKFLKHSIVKGDAIRFA